MNITYIRVFNCLWVAAEHRREGFAYWVPPPSKVQVTRDRSGYLCCNRIWVRPATTAATFDFLSRMNVASRTYCVAERSKRSKRSRLFGSTPLTSRHHDSRPPVLPFSQPFLPTFPPSLPFPWLLSSSPLSSLPFSSSRTIHFNDRDDSQ